MRRPVRGRPAAKDRRPEQMPDWFPEIGYKWMTYRMSVSPTLILVHPDHVPTIWNHNEDGEWDFMRELTIGPQGGGRR